MLRCGKRFTTYERIEKMDISIVKKDGSLEVFDVNKIVKGIRKAIDENKIIHRKLWTSRKRLRNS
jgi:transcriptional repressor NrdR